MTTPRQERIIKSLETINARLITLRSQIGDENRAGRQFDFVNTPRLANATSELLVNTIALDNIVFQKTKT